MKVAIIGTGWIAKANGLALSRLPDVTLVAMANRTISKAEKLRQELSVNCPIYTDFEKLLNSEKPDAVLINLAHHLHSSCFAACAAAGVNIIIEKPLANTYAECLYMIEIAARYRIKATVCHTQRYNVVYMAANQFLAEHDLGRLLSINDHIYIDYFRNDRPAWQLSNALSGGGIALNYGVHQLDRVHYFLKQQTEYFNARYLAAKPGFEIYSSYTMMGVGDGGTPYIATCTGYSGPFINETRLIFERGILQCNLVQNGIHPFGLYWGDNQTDRFQEVPIELSNDQIFEREFRAAIDYLSGLTTEAPVSLEWAAEMVRLVKIGMPYGKEDSVN